VLDNACRVTFEEIAQAARARLGHRVCVRIVDERGRLQNFGRGELAPGRPGAADAVVDDDGQIGFRVAPGHWHFLLHPAIVRDAREELDGKELRVELSGGGAVVIETLGTTGGSGEPRLQTPPTQAELRKAAGRKDRERARLEARERAR
jgi:hypothetical protein